MAKKVRGVIAPRIRRSEAQATEARMSESPVMQQRQNFMRGFVVGTVQRAIDDGHLKLGKKGK